MPKYRIVYGQWMLVPPIQKIVLVSTPILPGIFMWQVEPTSIAHKQFGIWA